VRELVVLQEAAAPMQRNVLEDLLCRWCDEEELDLVVTIGGTLPAPGPSSREIVPLVTLAVAERLLPGLGEAMRAYAQDELPLAIIDGSQGAIRGRTLLLNLPAGAVPATLFLEGVLDVIASLVAHLQEDPAAPRLAGPASGVAKQEPLVRSGLNAEDFAAFLKRKRDGQE
jgi:molybdopterin biosynthesis enzyme MoaB